MREERGDQRRGETRGGETKVVVDIYERIIIVTRSNSEAKIKFMYSLEATLVKW